MALADLTDLASVKDYAAVSGNAQGDEIIVNLITAYSAMVRSYTGRDITLSTYDIRRSGRGTFALQLPQYPVQSVLLLEVDGRGIQSQSAWGATGFRFDDEQIVLDGHSFSRGISNIRVVFTAGYAVVPADIKQAVTEIIALRYKLRTKQEWSSSTLDGQTQTLITKDMPASAKTILDSYVRTLPL